MKIDRYMIEEYTIPETVSGEKTFAHEEVFGNLRKKLKEHYGLK